MLENFVELAEITPDAMVIATKAIEISPIAGNPATTDFEIAYLSRYDKIVTVTLPVFGPLFGDVIAVADDDVETAEVAFTNYADDLRRDGWTLRDPEPWEIADPLDSDKVPF